MKRFKWFSISAFILTTIVCQAAAGATLTFWHGLELPESIQVLNGKMALFQQKTGIEVKLVHYGAADQVNSKIMSAVAGDKTPDVMWWGPMETGRMAKTGKLVKIDEFLKKDSSFHKADIYPALWVGGSKDHFKEAGLDPNRLNTWEDFREYAKKLTTEDHVGLELSIGTGEWLTFSTLLPFLWQAGGDFITPDGKEATFNSQAGIEALEYLSGLVNQDKCAKWSEPGAGYKTDNFLAGRVSMMIYGPWQMSALQAQDKVDYGAIPLPKNKKGATDLRGENLYLLHPIHRRKKWPGSCVSLSHHQNFRWIGPFRPAIYRSVRMLLMTQSTKAFLPVMIL